MEAEHRSTLLELGFEPSKAERALRATNNAGVEAALDWLEKHGDDPPEETDHPAGGPSTDHEPTLSDSNMAKGLKCTDCDKLFKNNALASYHSEKSGHVNFEEVEYENTPMTEEEKQDRLAQLREQLKARRLAKQKQEIEERKANEAIRRKGGKDMNNIREELKKKELDKELAQRQKDRLEDAKARARIKAEIEEDKQRRAKKAALERSKRLGIPPPEELPVGSTSRTNLATTASTSNHSEGRFQLRLPSPAGSVIVMTLKAEQTLVDLAKTLFQDPNFVQTELGHEEDVRFATTYPRKIFTAEEMKKSVKELGLLPAVILDVSSEDLFKKQEEEAEQRKAKNLANEAIRRKVEDEMRSIKEVKKRDFQQEIAQREKDKVEEAKAKARVREEIEEDKQRRARKAAFERSKRLGISQPEEPPVSSESRAKPTTIGSTSNHGEGRFQLRLPSPPGSVIVLNLKAEQTLDDLAQALSQHDDFLQTEYLNYPEKIQFSTMYPRKIFTAEEMKKSVRELGLLPAVALAVSFVDRGRRDR